MAISNFYSIFGKHPFPVSGICMSPFRMPWDGWTIISLIFTSVSPDILQWSTIASETCPEVPGHDHDNREYWIDDRR